MMQLDELLGTTLRLNASVEALAAVAALLRSQTEPIALPTDVQGPIRRVVEALGLGEIDSLPVRQRAAVLGAIRAYFLQAAELMEHPGREPGWAYEDPLILQSQGQGSRAVVAVLASVITKLDGLADRLGNPGSAFLDIGTGVGLLAIEMCSAHPSLSAVGIDVWEPALVLARKNVAVAGMAGRIDIRREDATAIADRDRFDLAWIPGPFLPATIVPAVAANVRMALKPGAWALLGLYASPPDPLAVALNELRIVRSGGYPWNPNAACRLLTDAGLTHVHVVERTWNAPVLFIVGRKGATP